MRRTNIQGHSITLNFVTASDPREAISPIEISLVVVMAFLHFFSPTFILCSGSESLIPLAPMKQKAPHHGSRFDRCISYFCHICCGKGVSIPARGNSFRREIRIIIPHKNSFEIGMIGKFNAKHVKSFTLMPISAGKYQHMKA